MTTNLVREAAFSTFVWTTGDFFAQFYAAHHEAAKRRIAGEKSKGERPSMHAMMALLDQPRLGVSAAFGLLLSPFIVSYRKTCLRVIGSTERKIFASFAMLSAQQLFMTPLALLAYHNAMTAFRGGFDNPNFLSTQEKDAHASARHDIMSVERRVLFDVMPTTLLASWSVFAPLALLGYVSAKHARGACAAACLIPWTAYVSYTQSTQLL